MSLVQQAMLEVTAQNPSKFMQDNDLNMVEVATEIDAHVQAAARVHETHNRTMQETLRNLGGTMFQLGYNTRKVQDGE